MNLIHELIDPALLFVNLGEKFTDDPLEQQGIVRQRIGSRGSVRHANLYPRRHSEVARLGIFPELFSGNLVTFPSTGIQGHAAKDE